MLRGVQHYTNRAGHSSNEAALHDGAGAQSTEDNSRVYLSSGCSGRAGPAVGIRHLGIDKIIRAIYLVAINGGSFGMTYA
jgi:hypothetical protein